MSEIDPRKPSLVTEAFRDRVAELLEPHGFVARAKGASFVRKVGNNVHRFNFGSSHLNKPGYVVCWVEPSFEDAAVCAIQKDWRAGGQLGGHDFAEQYPANVAVDLEAAELLTIIERHLHFFTLLEDHARMADEVCRRYVPGFHDPDEVVPYLHVHLGQAAVQKYARALLTARPELWPAFAAVKPDLSIYGDHGSQLSRAMREFAPSARPPEAPPDVVETHDRPPKALRDFFGLQLRAWGEAKAAGELRRVPDREILGVRKAQEKLAAPLVENPSAVRLLLAMTGDDRFPARKSGEPRLFQYKALHPPFATWK